MSMPSDSVGYAITSDVTTPKRGDGVGGDRSLSETLSDHLKAIAAGTDAFAPRHIGPSDADVEAMLAVLGYDQLPDLIDQAVPPSIRLSRDLAVPTAVSEHEALQELRAIASKNQVFRSYIGMGYHNCITPPVIQRNILENPGWYTQYTPYQPEIAQGRLEALLNFQTMVTDLTAMDIANASLLDEGTAAAEAMTLSYGQCKTKAKAFWVSDLCHPQTLEVVKSRALPLGITVIVGDHRSFTAEALPEAIVGALLQYPATDGGVYDYRPIIEQVHQAGGLVTVAADLLSLTLLTPPGEFGADIVVGSTQRFGVPMGYGGPHAAYFATREVYKRQLPGRLVGVSRDAQGQVALRLALQTREQHIRRDRATSNICTAQVLLAVMASMYAVYHGPQGLRRIATRIHLLTMLLAAGLERLGYTLKHVPVFDTLTVEAGECLGAIAQRAAAQRINLRPLEGQQLGISLDETTTEQDVVDLLTVFAGNPFQGKGDAWMARAQTHSDRLRDYWRQSDYLTHPVFNTYHSETELLRYMHHLQAKDLSLTAAMIPLGSCTMKLNATAEMIPVTWPEFGQIHPFAPVEQTEGYQILFQQLEDMLAEITGFAGISLQPNAGSQGEYAGLLVIRAYHQQRGQGHRQICLIPESAHGTNPASAVMAGMTVVPVGCDRDGNIDLADLQAKAEKHRDQLAALMVTYPSTHGVFEAGIRDICEIIHSYGGQVYMDGANMNAMVGLCRPAEIGIDVCHLNEGHCAFVSLARIANRVRGGTSFHLALEQVRASTVFTTHTPVPAGHDRFTFTELDGALGPWRAGLDLQQGSFMDLGRERPGDWEEPLCMTVLAMRTSAATSSVVAGKATRSGRPARWAASPPHGCSCGPPAPGGSPPAGRRVRQARHRSCSRPRRTSCRGWRRPWSPPVPGRRPPGFRAARSLRSFRASPPSSRRRVPVSWVTLLVHSLLSVAASGVAVLPGWVRYAAR